ncbi:DNA-processing protein DprA [Clostridium cylindrosporum]|uniref:DNA protecting protein DprA n=1 Tax=Clostridium cylindrosporum DSM 605 TaxID=1121307 RepID=A0A0J8DB75_CLOCY|nr:DNA-processing protein DprA [Clostridium cylindrosporum]KMT23087.1 DNA protecting protein DprA [Clostridium cylindrosporum DSM 605]
MSIFEKLWFTKVDIDKNIKLDILNKGIELKKLYNHSYENLLKLGLSLKDAMAFEKAKDSEYINKVIDYLDRENIRFVFITDKEYPALLKHIYMPPIGLFIKGCNINLNNSIGIVGARRASIYGKEVARKLAREISLNGITVISGLALGIDASAHIGSIEGSGITAAVIGSGHMHTYPKTNKHLYNEVLKKGCIISEYFPEQEPLKHRFPERNRIISGISKGTLVVEAGDKSGSLITANFALNQGREVYSIPGNIYSPTSIGCNKLIKEGAKIVIDVNDILEDFDCVKEISKEHKKNLDEDETNVVSCLESGNKSFEEVVNILNIPSNKLLVILSKLECRRIIKRVYGNYYSIYQT